MVKKIDATVEDEGGVNKKMKSTSKEKSKFVFLKSPSKKKRDSENVEERLRKRTKVTINEPSENVDLKVCILFLNKVFGYYSYFI